MRAWFEVGANVPDVTSMMMRSASPAQTRKRPARRGTGLCAIC
jgi:hypothetical protein